MDLLVVLARLVLMCVFAIAAIGKLADRDGARVAVAEFGIPGDAVGLVAFGLPLVELLVAAGLAIEASALWAAAVAVALLLLFCAGIVRLLSRGEAPDCHCFGRLGSTPVGRQTLIRNLALTALAGFVLVAGRSHGQSVSTLAGDVGPVAIVLGGAIILQAAFSWQLFTQNGRLLGRISALETALGGDAAGAHVHGPAIGEPAPDFSLRELDGETTTLGALLAEGRGALLVFTDPGCHHCNAVLPELGRHPGEHEPPLAVISRGSRIENLAKAREHGIDRLLLQEDFEVAALYGNHGLPSAVLIDPSGRIASPHAGGAQAVVALLSNHRPPPAPEIQLVPVASGGRA